MTCTRGIAVITQYLPRMPRANFKEVLLYFIELRMHVGGSKVKGLMALMLCHVFSFPGKC
jgi:hypothetical protein